VTVDFRFVPAAAAPPWFPSTHPLVMGVVNVTPDSFSDGGRFVEPAADGAVAGIVRHDLAIAHGRELAAQGADIVDVGGESTRPGALPVPLAEEIDRVLPVVEGLVAAGVEVSVDTRKAEVAEAAVGAGARLVNDVSATLAPVAAATGAGYVVMHMRGDPRTMQQEATYDDVVSEVRDFLVERAEAAVAAGVEQVWIDPGIGFGKRLGHNLDLLADLDVLVATGYPVLVGTSRKSMLGILAARADGRDASEPAPAGDRREGSLTTAAWALWRGAAMVRVHDVGETVRVARAVEALGAAA
jgi:dihydropteroate synthase